MLRVALCDDETDARDAVRFQLEKIIYEDDEEIVYEFTSGSSAVKWLKAHPGEIDLLFLDVEMEGLNGMDTARKIREFNQELVIVFLTGYSDYVFEGYEVGALDYVMKPAQEKRLRNIVSRVRTMLGRNREKVFAFKNTDGIFRMPVDRISYLYSDRRKVVLVTEEKEYPFYGKLDEVEEQLKGQACVSFVRIHQRYLVNADKVEHVGRGEVRVAGNRLPVSRSMKEEAEASLAKAMLEGEYR
ncbi:MAG: LytTR family DNA-binding domain-containing protein [Lachnospiraceae bacterium]|jgi:two-component system response regulator LytT|nr:LytTR family DNA-binding domain-containing protein [Lachnospiraceae bacterium]